MIYSFAPLEGITTSLFRRTHARFFPGADRYFAPFLAPDGSGRVKASALRDLEPENNADLHVIPQILCNRAEAFLSLTKELASMGYREINLNAGCPSGTVVPKHKGAGMLLDLRSLDAFLSEIFSRTDLNISVKTRLGLDRPEEFPAILELLNRYPFSELILHARVRSGMYKSIPDLGAFAAAFSESRAPMCYNGNILSPEHLDGVMSTVPSLERVMLGRGAVANPALFRQLKGGEKLGQQELFSFLDALEAGLAEKGLPERHILGWMKEIWYYVNYMFPGGARMIKQLHKARSLEEYRTAVRALAVSGSFDPEAAFPGAFPK